MPTPSIWIYCVLRIAGQAPLTKLSTLSSLAEEMLERRRVERKNPPITTSRVLCGRGCRIDHSSVHASAKWRSLMRMHQCKAVKLDMSALVQSGEAWRGVCWCKAVKLDVHAWVQSSKALPIMCAIYIFALEPNKCPSLSFSRLSPNFELVLVQYFMVLLRFKISRFLNMPLIVSHKGCF